MALQHQAPCKFLTHFTTLSDASRHHRSASINCRSLQKRAPPHHYYIFPDLASSFVSFGAAHLEFGGPIYISPSVPDSGLPSPFRSSVSGSYFRTIYSLSAVSPLALYGHAFPSYQDTRASIADVKRSARDRLACPTATYALLLPLIYSPSSLPFRPFVHIISLLYRFLLDVSEASMPKHRRLVFQWTSSPVAAVWNRGRFQSVYCGVTLPSSLRDVHCLSSTPSKRSVNPYTFLVACIFARGRKTLSRFCNLSV
jgi:hypothetical protein